MVLETVSSFRAVREFKPEPVPEETIREILNAGRRSQSSKNTQPWHFIVVRDPETRAALSKTGKYAGHIAGAAFAVVLATHIEDDFDIGQSVAYMMLTAWDLGVGSCIASIYELEQAREILGLPVKMRVRYAVSFGFPAGPVDRPLKKGGRRPLDEVVHWEQW